MLFGQSIHWSNHWTNNSELSGFNSQFSFYNDAKVWPIITICRLIVSPKIPIVFYDDKYSSFLLSHKDSSIQELNIPRHPNNTYTSHLLLRHCLFFCTPPTDTNSFHDLSTATSTINFLSFCFSIWRLLAHLIACSLNSKSFTNTLL